MVVYLGPKHVVSLLIKVFLCVTVTSPFLSLNKPFSDFHAAISPESDVKLAAFPSMTSSPPYIPVASTWSTGHP
jgi:hypothetical protein